MTVANPQCTQTVLSHRSPRSTLLCSSLWDVTSWHCLCLYRTFDWFRFIWQFVLCHTILSERGRDIVGLEISFPSWQLQDLSFTFFLCQHNKQNASLTSLKLSCLQWLHQFRPNCAFQLEMMESCFPQSWLMIIWKINIFIAISQKHVYVTISHTHTTETEWWPNTVTIYHSKAN